jgi:4-hydroxy-tetrahydrodipicolinate reductase
MSTPLAIVGCGKMGRLVEQLAPEYGFEVCAKFSRSNVDSLSRQLLRGAEVAIEFSTPAGAPENLRKLANFGVNTVCGTTGWYAELPQIRKAIAEAHSGLVFGANFSVGVNLFFEVVARAAALFSRHPEYEAWGWEIHHSAKKDAP